MSTLTELEESIKTGNRSEATRLTEQAITAETPAKDILDALLDGMDDVGQRFKRAEVFVPEVSNSVPSGL